MCQNARSEQQPSRMHDLNMLPARCIIVAQCQCAKIRLQPKPSQRGWVVGVDDWDRMIYCLLTSDKKLPIRVITLNLFSVINQANLFSLWHCHSISLQALVSKDAAIFYFSLRGIIYSAITQRSSARSKHETSFNFRSTRCPYTFNNLIVGIPLGLVPPEARTLAIKALGMFGILFGLWL